MNKIAGIAQVIRTRLRTNHYADKIPGERALASEFGVDFKTANRAVTTLVEEGALIRRRGLGTFIAPARQRRNLTVGLCFYKFSDPGRDPVFTRFFAGMNQAITTQGMRCDVTALSDLAVEDMPAGEQAERFRVRALASDPDGLIWLGNVDTQLIELLRADRPTIVIGPTPEAMRFDSVRRDVRAGVADAVRHLHGLGHRRIALMTYHRSAASYDLAEKESGYTEAVAGLGVPAQILRVAFPPEAKPAQLVLDAQPRPTAVVCSESTLGIALLRHGERLGLPPSDLALVAFDDGEVGSYTSPSMSGITAFGEDLARLAIQRLLERLDGGAVGPIDDRLPCVFTARGTSQPPAGR